MIADEAAFAAPITCRESIALLTIYKMKDQGFKAAADSDSVKRMNCEKIDFKNLEIHQSEMLNRCEKVKLPDGELSGRVGDTPCNDMLYSSETSQECDVSKIDPNWNISMARSKSEFLEESLSGFGSDSNCTKGLLKAKFSNIIGHILEAGISKNVCEMVSDAIEQVYKKEQLCDIAPAENEETSPTVTNTNLGSASCEIPDASGLCPGEKKVVPQANKNFVQLEAPKAKRVRKKTSSLRRSNGSATIRN